MLEERPKMEFPYLTADNDVVIEANSSFIGFTGYMEQEIVGRALVDVLRILKIAPKFDLKNTDAIQDYFLFTKALEYRNIKIRVEELSGGRVKYIFCEKQNSRFEDKFNAIQKLFTDERFGMGVYSAPDLTLIKANQTYLNILDEPLCRREESIGMVFSDIVDKTKYGRAHEVFTHVISTKETYYAKEIKGITGTWKDSYCDNTVIPVIEDGKVRYIISMIEDVTDKVLNRQRAEEQAKLIERQSKELEAILENMSDGLGIMEAEGTFSFLNDSAKEFLYNGDSLEKVQDDVTHSSYYDIDGKSIPLEQMPGFRVLRGEKLKACRVTAKRPDGTHHFEISGSPIYNENGSIKKAVVCCRNVTEHVEREKFIELQNKQLQNIVDNISEELYVFDKDGKYLLINKASKDRDRLVGLENIKDYLNKYGLYDVSGSKVKNQDLPSLRVMNGEVVREYITMVCDPDKRYVSTNGMPILDEDGNFIMGILSRRDVTSGFLHKQAIERQLDMLYKIIHNLELPLLRLSYPELVALDINHEAYKLASSMYPDIKSPNHIKGKKLTSLMPDFDKGSNYEYIRKAAAEKKTKYSKYNISDINGEEMHANIIYNPILGLNGEVEEIVMVLIDVTSEVKANKAMEKILNQQEEFFANFSHELKTPLNLIYSTVQLFNMYCKEGSLDEKRDSIIKYVNTITQNCNRLSRLVNNIVDLSKIEAGFYELNRSNQDIVSVVEEIVMSVADYTQIKGLNIIFDTDVEEKIIACDPEKIERVVLNLISNAIKFSDAGDEICVSVSDIGDVVDISVKDNGTGIDKRNIGKIFDRFKQVDKSFTRNAEGSGIGLSLVKSIVELHGGRVTVKSELGKGSKFSVLLPAGEIEEAKSTLCNNLMRNNRQIVNVELSDIDK